MTIVQSCPVSLCRLSEKNTPPPNLSKIQGCRARSQLHRFPPHSLPMTLPALVQSHSKCFPDPMALCTQHFSTSAKRQLEKEASISALIFVSILEALCRLCISGLQAKLRSKDALYMDNCQLERIAAFCVPKRAIRHN